MFRIAFDPDRPLVATSSFKAGDGTVEAGEVFDWRARGMAQIDALAMFRSGLLAHPPSLPATADAKPAVLEMPGVAAAATAEKIERAERKRRR